MNNLYYRMITKSDYDMVFFKRLFQSKNIFLNKLIDSVV